MAPKIKLQRVGAKNQPKYRVVIQEAREKLGGKIVEVLGSYNPRLNPALFEVDKDKVLSWIKKGAQATEKVRILLGKAGILPAIDLQSLPKRKKKGEEAPEGKKAEASNVSVEPPKEVGA